MKKVKNKLRVLHYPQIPCKPFSVDAKDEEDTIEIPEWCPFKTNQHQPLP